MTQKSHNWEEDEPKEEEDDRDAISESSFSSVFPERKDDLVFPIYRVFLLRSPKSLISDIKELAKSRRKDGLMRPAH